MTEKGNTFVTARSSTISAMVLLRAVVVMALAAAATGCNNDRSVAPVPAAERANPQGPPPQAPPPAAAPAPPEKDAEDGEPTSRYTGPLPPLRIPPFVREPQVVRAVYEFAARNGDVLRYVPCFCGCERNGHKGNDDCFVASRAADGRPQWDFHGMG